MRYTPRDRSGERQALAARLGRTGRWAATLLALAMLLQAGSPAFVPACARGAVGGKHGCPVCRGPARSDAGAPVPACHAAADAHHGAPSTPAPKPCCFLEAGPACGHAALPEVTLVTSGSQPLPLELSGDPDGATARSAAEGARFVFPPGIRLAMWTGPPDAARHPILRL